MKITKIVSPVLILGEMRNERFKPLLHILIWLLVYLLPHIVAYGTDISLQEIFDKAGVIHGISTLLLIGYAYFNYNFLVPKFYLNRKYVWFAVLVIACVLMVIWFPNVFGSVPKPDFNAGPPPFTGKPPSGHGPDAAIWFGKGYNIILFIIITLGAISLRQQLQLLQAQNEKTDAELSFLKAQINPHFLFNTLNSIYALAIQKSDDTPNAIIQLSELMRYLLKEATTDFVPLSKELSYINNYVQLQKRRLGDTVVIHYKSPQLVTDFKIAPLILMSFIENAFKHGVNPDEDSEITIDITLIQSKLYLLVKNKKVTSASGEEAVGIGLKNTIGRLEHLYAAKHALKINDDSKLFTIELSMNLA